MKYQFTPYIFVLLVSAFIMLLLAIYAFSRRNSAKGAQFFLLLTILLSCWSAFNALEMASLLLPDKLFWANLQYISYAYTPFAILALALDFTGHDKWIKNKKILCLAVIPTLTVILAFTDSWHGLIRHDFYLELAGPFPIVGKSFGPYFYFHAIYSQILALVALFFLFRAVFIEKTIYRKQASALFLGSSLIIVPNLIYALGLGLPIDITPIFCVPAGLTAAYGVFRYKLFELLPVARATVIETMDAAMIVIDLQNRILDVNPAFENLFGIRSNSILTRPVSEVCPYIPEISQTFLQHDHRQVEFSASLNQEQHFFEMLLSPLTDQNQAVLGKLALIRDITERKKEQESYTRQVQELAAKEEMERLARDLHDNLGQVLGFINLQAQGIQHEFKKAEIELMAPQLERLIVETQAAHEEIRSYIRQSRSQKSGDFLKAMNQSIQDCQKQWGITITKELQALPAGLNISPDAQANILNILKEAINNAARHANAPTITITLLFFDQQLLLFIEDDGRGFDISIIKEGHFGLNIMKERAAEMDGKLTIESEPNKGSRICLYLNL